MRRKLHLNQANRRGMFENRKLHHVIPNAILTCFPRCLCLFRLFNFDYRYRAFINLCFDVYEKGWIRNQMLPFQVIVPPTFNWHMSYIVGKVFTEFLDKFPLRFLNPILRSRYHYVHKYRLSQERKKTERKPNVDFLMLSVRRKKDKGRFAGNSLS